MEVLVSTAAYAKYGLVSGTIVESPELVVECILVCKGWPSWAFGAQGAGFYIQALIMLPLLGLPRKCALANDSCGFLCRFSGCISIAPISGGFCIM
jgi:hypothetical protein